MLLCVMAINPFPSPCLHKQELLGNFIIPFLTQNKSQLLVTKQLKTTSIDKKTANLKYEIDCTIIIHL